MDSLEIDLRKLAQVIENASFVMLTTVNLDASMQSRPMATVKLNKDQFNGKLYFFSKRGTQKVESIERDQHVNLAYALPKQNRFISITGRGSLIDDKELMNQMWDDSLKQWIPDGLSDPDLSLIAVEVETADIWQVPENKVLKLIGRLRKTKNKTFSTPESEHLDLSSPQ